MQYCAPGLPRDTTSDLADSALHWLPKGSWLLQASTAI